MPVAFSRPAALEDRAAGRSRRQQMQRLPAEFGHLADRLRRRLAGGDVVENVGARLRQVDQLGIDRRLGQIVALLHDHLGGAAGICQHLLERRRGSRGRNRRSGRGCRSWRSASTLTTCLARMRASVGYSGSPAMVHLKFFGSFHFDAPVLSRQLRHALRVEIFVHGGLRRGAERAEQRQHFLLLDQPPRRLDAFRRAVGIVHGEELDLAAVDAALLVQHLEIGLADPAEHAIERAGAGMRHGLAELDLGIARARIVFLLRRPDEGRGHGRMRSAAASAVAPNSRRVCLFFIVVSPCLGALIRHSGVGRQ